MRGQEGEMVSSALIANGVKAFSIHRVGEAPQGIFCANGQCSQCTVIINGKSVKSCVTPLETGMDIRTLHQLPSLPLDDADIDVKPPREISCDVLVIGGGPSGIRAACELAKQGFSVLIVDDKNRLGGKLVLQTHKFFGSMADCYAGTRGNDIGQILEEETEQWEQITIMRNSTVVAVYSDGKAGIFENNSHYTHVIFKGLIVAAGARERSLVFPGNDLPGVYGAGAFQTLVNRDLVRASERVLIVGCGNVGLIAAYHALQAGITVVGLIDIAKTVSGYKVHADKLKRMGVPIYLGYALICAEGDSMVERATIAPIDDQGKPRLQAALTFAVDTVLVAVGLQESDDFYDIANEFGFPVLKAGDADEIAEASSAMIGGKIVGRKMARMLGKEVKVEVEWYQKAKVLKSPPGRTSTQKAVSLTEEFRPIFHCNQEIPCNPCTTVCTYNSIKLRPNKKTFMDLPKFEGKCVGCGLCVAVCPGLAITLARLKQGTDMAEVMLPHEFDHEYKSGDEVPITDTEGAYLGLGTVVKLKYNKKYRTHLITVEVPGKWAVKAAGIRVQNPEKSKPLPQAVFNYLPEDGIVCRCERVTVGQIIKFIKENNVRDINQLKPLRIGMGACGGKTCLALLPQVFAQAGLDYDNIEPATKRPLEVEVPMWAIANQERE